MRTLVIESHKSNRIRVDTYCTDSLKAIEQGKVLQVVYDEKQQHQLVCSLLDAAADFLNTENIASDQAFVEDFADALAYPLIDAAIRIKHPGFSEEKEWRLVVDVGDIDVPGHEELPEVFFRSVDGCLVPYVKCKLPEGCIKIIKQRPGHVRDRNDFALKKMLSSRNHSVVIQKSIIPMD